MKILLYFFLFIFSCSEILAQERDIDSVKSLYGLTDYYVTQRNNPDSAMLFASQGLELSKKINFWEGEVNGLSDIGILQTYKGQIDSAFQTFYAGMAIRDVYLPQNLELQLKLFVQLGTLHAYINPDSAKYYANKLLLEANSVQKPLYEAIAIRSLAGSFLSQGNYPQTMRLFFRYKQIAKKNKDPFFEASSFRLIGLVYSIQNNYRQAIQYYDTAELKAGNLSSEKETLFHFCYLGRELLMRNVYASKARAYLSLNELDSALKYANLSYKLAISNFNISWLGNLFNILGDIYRKMGRDSISVNYFRQGISSSFIRVSVIDAIQSYNGLAQYFYDHHILDSCIFYANKAVGLIQISGVLLNEPITYGILANAYEKERNIDSGFKYIRLMQNAKDSLLGMGKVEEMQLIVFDEKQQQLEEQAAGLAYRNKVKYYSLLGGIALLLTIAIFLWRSSVIRQRSFLQIKQQQTETEFQRKTAEEALKKLQDIQSQLIQSEKMASLGELTAGIAHEIQNPLNFVNNFSEINAELFDEMEKEMESGNLTNLKVIAKDIRENERKITHHGKRADAIVKGMLQHSRMSTGQKEYSDINGLVAEYLRLCYHGLRAKDNSFNVIMQSEFDHSIGEIKIIVQDFGRVLLNLFNNAFYSVSEKKRLDPQGYEPTVSVVTKRLVDKLEIRVKDNGNGIPPKIIDKIFQPFFTTKPAGQGTGLGLSLSYDIIKAHGGELRVNSSEGIGAEFIIVMPFTM